MNEFLVSVGRVIVRDPETQVGLFYGNAQITTAFTTSMTATEVRAGVGNALLYTYMHDKKVEIKLTQATFNMSILGFNSGQLPTTGVYNVLNTDSVTLVAGVGTTTLTPLSDIAVFLADGTIQNVTPTGKSFTVVNGGTQVVSAIYTVAATAEQIRIEAATPPKVLDVTIIGELRDDSGALNNYLHINVPELQTDGNFTYSMAANGVSQLDIGGFAIVATDTDGQFYYAKQWRVPAASSAVPVTGIVAIPSTLVFATGAAASKNISVLAIKGTTNVNVTTTASFTTSGSVFVSGLHTGLVTVSASAAGVTYSGSTWVNYYDSVSGSYFNDYVNLVVQ